MSKKSPKKKKDNPGSYGQALASIAKSIHDTVLARNKALDNGDKIAAWTLGTVHEDLIKLYHRVNTVRYTVKGNKD